MHFLEAKLTIAGMRIWANHILLSKRKNLKGKDKKAYFPVIDFWHRIIVGGQLPLFIAIGVSSLSPQSVAVLLKLVPLPSTGSKSPILPKKKSSFENLGLLMKLDLYDRSRGNWKMICQASWILDLKFYTYASNPKKMKLKVSLLRIQQQHTQFAEDMM